MFLITAIICKVKLNEVFLLAFMLIFWFKQNLKIKQLFAEIQTC